MGSDLDFKIASEKSQVLAKKAIIDEIARIKQIDVDRIAKSKIGHKIDSIIESVFVSG